MRHQTALELALERTLEGLQMPFGPPVHFQQYALEKYLDRCIWSKNYDEILKELFKGRGWEPSEQPTISDIVRRWARAGQSNPVARIMDDLLNAPVYPVIEQDKATRFLPLYERRSAPNRLGMRFEYGVCPCGSDMDLLTGLAHDAEAAEISDMVKAGRFRAEYVEVVQRQPRRDAEEEADENVLVSLWVQNGALSRGVMDDEAAFADLEGQPLEVGSLVKRLVGYLAPRP